MKGVIRLGLRGQLGQNGFKDTWPKSLPCTLPLVCPIILRRLGY